MIEHRLRLQPPLIHRTCQLVGRGDIIRRSCDILPGPCPGLRGRAVFAGRRDSRRLLDYPMRGTSRSSVGVQCSARSPWRPSHPRIRESRCFYPSGPADALALPRWTFSCRTAESRRRCMARSCGRRKTRRESLFPAGLAWTWAPTGTQTPARRNPVDPTVLGEFQPPVLSSELDGLLTAADDQIRRVLFVRSIHHPHVANGSAYTGKSNREREVTYLCARGPGS